MRDGRTGAATGIIRASAFSLLAIHNNNRLSEDQQLEALKDLLHLYNAVGITSVCSGGGPPEELSIFEKLLDRGELT